MEKFLSQMKADCPLICSCLKCDYYEICNAIEGLDHDFGRPEIWNKHSIEIISQLVLNKLNEASNE